MPLPDILDDDHIDDAAKLLGAYYTTYQHAGLPRTGSRFDSWAGGGDAPGMANRVTADDVVAVSFLSSRFRPSRLRSLETHAA